MIMRMSMTKTIFFVYLPYAEHYAWIDHLKLTAQQSYKVILLPHMCMYPDIILLHSCYPNKSMSYYYPYTADDKIGLRVDK